MFAIAFDLTVAEVAERHPRGVTQAYNDIGNTLAAYGFDRKQGSVSAKRARHPCLSRRAMV
jgi:virulence-associated protein VapD